MLPSVHSHVIASLGIAGASLIVVTPAAPPLSTIQMPAIQLTSATESLDLLVGPAQAVTTAFPVITPTEFFSDTVQNLQADAAAIMATGTPILTQLIDDETAYAQDIGTGLQSAGTALETLLQGLPAQLQTAFGLIESGDYFDALTGLSGYLEGGLLINVGFPVIGALSQVVQDIGTNISNLGSESTLALAALGLVAALIVGPNSESVAADGLIQNLVDGVSTGNFQEVLTTLLDAPSTLLSAPLNGYDDVSCNDCVIDPTAGLLTGVPGSTQPSAGDGGLGGILMAEQAIAQALGASSSTAAAVQDPLSGLAADLTSLLSGSGLSDLSGLSADLLNLF
jgi:hypothetical protein